MAFEITLISIAIVVLVALFAHKYVEMSRGASPRIQGARSKADAHVETVVKHAETAVSSITLRNGVFVANGAVVWVARFFLVIFSTVSRVFHHIVEHGSRRHESLKQGGAASFYLKQIKEEKDTQSTTADGNKE